MGGFGSGSRVDHDVRTFGQSVVGVLDGDPWYYTIGNAERGLPELIINLNVDPKLAAFVLNTLGEKQRELGAPLLGEVHVGGEKPLILRPVLNLGKVRDEYTIQAGQRLGREDYDVTHVLFPDKEGRLPQDPLCHEVFRRPAL